MSDSIPVPGAHSAAANSEVVREEVEQILADVAAIGAAHGDEPQELPVLAEQASLLDRAHDLLARALSTVDRV